MGVFNGSDKHRMAERKRLSYGPIPGKETTGNKVY